MAVMVGGCWAQTAERSPAFEPQAPPSVVLVIMDDVGRDLLEVYGSHPDTACTPNIDRIAAAGRVYRNFWATPACSQTRAQVLTGLYSHVNGVGDIVRRKDVGGLTPQGSPLTGALWPYEAHLVGKWHLSPEAAPRTAPNDWGYADYRGSFRNLGPGDYLQWRKTVNGVDFNDWPVYATIDTTNDAISALKGLPWPRFVQVAYNAIHTPHTLGEDAFCPDACRFCPHEGAARMKLEILDAEIGRLYDALPPRTLFILFGDNGTAPGAILPPWAPNRAKGTVYDGGVRVPFIAAGHGVTPGESEALISVADIYPTIVEVMDRPEVDGLSGVSFAATLAGGEGQREYLFSERFAPNFAPGEPWQPEYWDRAVSDGRWRLVVKDTATARIEELYDIEADRHEIVNLIGAEPVKAAELRGVLQTMGVY